MQAAELLGILYAINIINKAALQRWRLSGLCSRTATILNDSMSALQAVQNPKTKSAQQFIYAILRPAKNTKSHCIAIRRKLVPGYCKAPENDTLDQFAREATVPGNSPRYYLARRLSTLSGRRSGKNPEQVATSGGSITHFPPSTRGGFTDRYRGIEPIC